MTVPSFSCLNMVGLTLKLECRHSAKNDAIIRGGMKTKHQLKDRKGGEPMQIHAPKSSGAKTRPLEMMMHE